jgi:hypothetical protein
MGVFLRFRDPQLPATVPTDLLSEDTGQADRRKGHGKGEIRLIFGHGHQLQQSGPDTGFETGKDRITKGMAEFPHPIGAEVEEDDRIVIHNPAHRLIVIIDQHGGCDEFIGLARHTTPASVRSHPRPSGPGHGTMASQALWTRSQRLSRSMAQ